MPLADWFDLWPARHICHTSKHSRVDLHADRLPPLPLASCVGWVAPSVRRVPHPATESHVTGLCEPLRFDGCGGAEAVLLLDGDAGVSGGLGRSFDVALEEGCGEVVVDWVVQVCSDPAAASADPVEAHLMDGRCAQQWARRALSTSQSRLLQVPPVSSPPGTAAAAGFASFGRRVQPIALACNRPVLVSSCPVGGAGAAAGAHSRRGADGGSCGGGPPAQPATHPAGAGRPVPPSGVAHGPAACAGSA